MAPSVIVYSPDDIRGRIVLKILKVSGIKTLLFSSHFEVKEAIARYSPAVIILDIKKSFSSELNFLQTLSYNLSEATIIALSGTSDVHVLENLGLTNLLCVPDPLDPELILSMVKDILAGGFSIRTCLRILQQALFKGFRFFIRSLKIIILLVIGLLGGYIYWCVSTLPAIGNLDEYSPYESSKIFSYDNVLLTEFYVERRTFIPHEKIPKHVINAFIAVEDTRYYKHHGIDLIRTIGALFRNIKEGAFVQGGSTITQQLAKMLFLKPEKTITRKIKEIV
ncbi:MAG: transglycosylase domain-containing protein, partial [Desulfobacteraceae bacterium]|nr:transglycosylase domain-containing protein [Desulfobacteraceae bacterium]